jgi:hypothetical protein
VKFHFWTEGYATVKSDTKWYVTLHSMKFQPDAKEIMQFPFGYLKFHSGTKRYVTPI